MEKTILIVDDDDNIREVVGFALRKEGFCVKEAEDGRQALSAFAEHKPDLVILDILMPGLDGTEVCRRVRADSDVPIIFLTCKDEEIDRVVGLELGADDYVIKPFGVRELVARVRALFRRVGPSNRQAEAPQERNAVEYGLLVLDLDACRAYWNQEEVVLTRTEFGLLRTLMAYPGKVYSRDEIMDGAYGSDHYVSDRTVDSHVKSVRKKLKAAGGDPIQTCHGLGYRLGPCE